MLFATLALRAGGVRALIGYFGFGQSPNIPFFAVLCLACVAYDLCVDRRVRPVTLVGVLLLFGAGLRDRPAVRVHRIRARVIRPVSPTLASRPSPLTVLAFGRGHLQRS